MVSYFLNRSLLSFITFLTLSFKLTYGHIANTFNTGFENDFKVKHLKVGDNLTYPLNTDNVTVHYNGTFPTTGISFDSSYSRNSTFTFQLNNGKVIKCWDQVVEKMSLGERIYVVCPSTLAYGSNGVKDVIPPNTDIAFDINLLCINNNCQPKWPVVKNNLTISSSYLKLLSIFSMVLFVTIF